MKVLIRTDKHTALPEQKKTPMKEALKKYLFRFKNDLTRIHLHLSDKSATRRGPTDMRCQMEARLKGKQPLSVSDEDKTMEGAIKGASQKLKDVIERTLDKQRKH